jgi:hypothetical protein
MMLGLGSWAGRGEWKGREENGTWKEVKVRDDD